MTYQKPSDGLEWRMKKAGWKVQILSCHWHVWTQRPYLIHDCHHDLRSHFTCCRSDTGTSPTSTEVEKVHLASVVTDVSVYLHSFFRFLPMEEIISWRVLTCSLPKTWRVLPHTQYLGYNEGLGSGLPTSTALQHTIFSVSLPSLKFVLLSPY